TAEGPLPLAGSSPHFEPSASPAAATTARVDLVEGIYVFRTSNASLVSLIYTYRRPFSGTSENGYRESMRQSPPASVVPSGSPLARRSDLEATRSSGNPRIIAGHDPMKASPAVHVRFEEYELDSGTRLLLKAGTPVALTPKAFQLLELLIKKRPAIVSKTDILQ